MSWLRTLLRREDPKAAPGQPAQEVLDGWLRAAYDAAIERNLPEAQRLYRKVLEHDPRDADALYFLGIIANAEGREMEAGDLLLQAVESRPRDAEAWMSLGIAYHHQRRLAEAAEAFRAGLALQPQNAAMRNNLSGTLIELGKGEEARVEMERLLESRVESDQLLCNLGHVYRDQARIDDALAAFRRALELSPNNAEVFTNLLLTLNYSDRCSAEDIFREHLRYGARFVKPYPEPEPDREWPRRLRIGYVSPDFRKHVVAVFMEPILRRRDRSRFEVFCYYNHRWEDRVTERFRELSDHWIHCVHMQDDELAQRIRADRIDILVDLTGHTGDNRLLLFSAKPAPLQASYLGYPNTTGLSAMDYRITDAKADPPGEAERYSVEKLVRPWPTYFCYEPPENCPEVAPPPAGAQGPITFGCFNNLPKVSNAFLDAAAQVLLAVPGSRLFLKSRPLGIPHVAERLRERFVRVGIDPARVELRGWEETAQHHLAAYGKVDIALDSFPYNGATTSCEALWMGVPVVTVAGDRHAGRMGASLLSAVGLADLVAQDVPQYVRICAALAADRARLAELRAGLRERVRRSPLLDEAGFVRALEDSYVAMWEEKLRPQARAALDAAGMEAALRRATELRASGERLESEALCKQVLRAKPDHEGALNLLWDLSYETGNHGVAVEWLRRGIAANDKLPRLHYMIGYSLLQQGNPADAMTSFHKAVTLDPAMAKGFNNLGAALQALGQLEPAEECYRRAVALEPALADALYNLGNLKRHRGRFDEAVRDMESAVQLDAGRADWKCNLGDLLFYQLRLDDAVRAYDDALALDPDYADAYAGRAAARQELGLAAAADEDMQRAMALEPEDAGLHSRWLLGRHYENGNDAALLLREHVEWARRHTQRIGWQAARAPHERAPKRRLNIGYVSGDFKRHSVASFFRPLLAAHDRSRFKIFCYSNVAVPDAVTAELRGLAEEWRDISALTDDWAAERMRADRLDVLVDLGGHTGDGRMLLFARKPAPVQVSWLGYPGTTGLAAIDYRLTDGHADPEGASDDGYVEKLVRLPSGFLCYAPPADAPEPQAAPALERGQVTFGCFNHLPKLTDGVIALWARLLEQAPDARLVLKSFGLSAESARAAMLARFARHGIAAQRVHLCGPERAFADHLAKYGEIDIALDVFPYNGVTTTCEALWMGVPVVTLRGATHVARAASSILASVGLDELIAETPEAYVSTALGLARDTARLRALRSGLRERMRGSPLMDAQGFTRSLEAAYCAMVERWRADEAARDQAAGKAA
ncbi:MAG TPA: tetratricopeptide repeat protein [Burkholderiales bacterium]|nr:tetratricopeptide repeat protein [Burkholderiales bacterium]